MISYGILAQRETELKARTAAGKTLDGTSLRSYGELCALTIGSALELYRYEYGHLPTSADELVRLDYFDHWPGDPENDWAPLALHFSITDHPGGIAVETKHDGGGYVLYNTRGFDFSAPAATWLETEAKLHGQDYKAYEQHLSQTYPDRMLWPASKIVVPPPAAPAQGAK